MIDQNHEKVNPTGWRMSFSLRTAHRDVNDLMFQATNLGNIISQWTNTPIDLSDMADHAQMSVEPCCEGNENLQVLVGEYPIDIDYITLPMILHGLSDMFSDSGEAENPFPDHTLSFVIDHPGSVESGVLAVIGQLQMVHQMNVDPSVADMEKLTLMEEHPLMVHLTEPLPEGVTRVKSCSPAIHWVSDHSDIQEFLDEALYGIESDDDEDELEQYSVGGEDEDDDDPYGFEDDDDEDFIHTDRRSVADAAIEYLYIKYRTHNLGEAARDISEAWKEATSIPINFVNLSYMSDSQGTIIVDGKVKIGVDGSVPAAEVTDRFASALRDQSGEYGAMFDTGIPSDGRVGPFFYNFEAIIATTGIDGQKKSNGDKNNNALYTIDTNFAPSGHNKVR